MSSETDSHIYTQIVVVAATTTLNFHVPLCSVGNHGWYFILLSFNPFQVEYSKYTSEYYTHSEVNLKSIYFSNTIYQPNAQIFKSIIITILLFQSNILNKYPDIALEKQIYQTLFYQIFTNCDEYLFTICLEYFKFLD